MYSEPAGRHEAMTTATPRQDPEVRPRATCQDVLEAPRHQVAEIVDGALYTNPRPAAPHALAASALEINLGTAFQFGRGGPGGWWIIVEPELHPSNDEQADERVPVARTGESARAVQEPGRSSRSAGPYAAGPRRGRSRASGRRPPEPGRRAPSGRRRWAPGWWELWTLAASNDSAPARFGDGPGSAKECTRKAPAGSRARRLGEPPGEAAERLPRKGRAPPNGRRRKRARARRCACLRIGSAELWRPQSAIRRH